jgi:hypothetical protein
LYIQIKNMIEKISRTYIYWTMLNKRSINVVSKWLHYLYVTYFILYGNYQIICQNIPPPSTCYRFLNCLYLYSNIKRWVSQRYHQLRFTLHTHHQAITPTPHKVITIHLKNLSLFINTIIKRRHQHIIKTYHSLL